MHEKKNAKKKLQTFLLGLQSILIVCCNALLFSSFLLAMEAPDSTSFSFAAHLQALTPTTSATLQTAALDTSDQLFNYADLLQEVIRESGMSFVHYTEQSHLDQPTYNRFYTHGYLATEFSSDRLLLAARANEMESKSVLIEKRINTQQRSTTAQQRYQSTTSDERCYLLPSDDRTDSFSVMLVSPDRICISPIKISHMILSNDGSQTVRQLFEGKLAECILPRSIEHIFYAQKDDEHIDLSAEWEDTMYRKKDSLILTIRNGIVKKDYTDGTKIRPWRQYADGSAVYVTDQGNICTYDSTTQTEDIILELYEKFHKNNLLSIDLAPNKKHIIVVEHCPIANKILLLDLALKKIIAFWWSPLIHSAQFMHDSTHCLCLTNKCEKWFIKVFNFFLPRCKNTDYFPFVDWGIYKNPKLQMKQHADASSEYPYKDVYPFDGEPFTVKTARVGKFNESWTDLIISTHRQKPLVAINGRVYEEVRAQELRTLTTVAQLLRARSQIQYKKKENKLTDSAVQEIVQSCMQERCG